MMGRSRSRSILREEDPGEGSSRSGVAISNRYATLPTDEVFSQPAAKEKRSKKRKKNRYSDGTSGRDDVPTTNVSEICDSGVAAENIIAVGAAKVKLPPLVVKNVHLNELIAELAALGVQAEYKLGRVGTKVVLRTKVEYELVVAHLKNANAEFFTHDIPGERPFKVVVRGLPNYDPKLIETELKDRYKLDPIAVFRITRKDKTVNAYPDCLFLVHFPKGTVTLNTLKAIRSINSIIVRWEPYRGGRRDVTQCQRCLNFGHGTRNCHIKPRCGKCALNHVTTECADETRVVKCVNCGGAHQGNDRQCIKREEFKLIRKQASANNPQGRRKETLPAFRPEDFPLLRQTQQGPANPWTRCAPSQEPSSASPGQNSPTPPGFRSQPTAQANNPDLFSADELMDIFVNMTSALRKCRSKPEQIQVLGKFIIQYGV